MRETLQRTCDLFFQCREVVKEAYKWENDSLVSVCASVFVNHDRMAESEMLKTCKALLKEQTGIFSNFRGTVELPVVSMMAVTEDPAEKLAKALKYYEALKQYFSASEYLVLAAAILADKIPEEQMDAVAARAKKIYKLMKEEHPFLTSDEDSVSAVMLAIADKNDDKVLIAEVERAYKILKETFSSGNDVQAVANIMVLAMADGDVEAKCRKLVALYEQLKAAGAKYGKYHELTTLAALSILPEHENVMVEDILAVDAYLAEYKPYKGVLGLDKKTRLMHAAMIVSSGYSKSEDAGIAAMTSTLAMIAAQQAAMCAVMCASVAASASASASN